MSPKESCTSLYPFIYDRHAIRWNQTGKQAKLLSAKAERKTGELSSGTKGQRFESSRAYEASLFEVTLFCFDSEVITVTAPALVGRENQLVGKLVGRNS
jgi:hypothetical protein